MHRGAQMERCDVLEGARVKKTARELGGVDDVGQLTLSVVSGKGGA